MDPLSQSIFCDLIANGVCSLVSYTYGRTRSNHWHGLRRALERDKALGDIVSKAAASIARTLPSTEAKDAKLQSFLASPEAESIIRQIYSARSINNKESTALAQRELTHALALYTGGTAPEMEETGRELFRAILAGIDKALSFATEQGSIMAHEALSSRRYNILHDEIANIQRNLDLLIKHPNYSPVLISEYETSLRAQVLTRHSHIMPPNFDAARKIPIDRLYVSPDLLTLGPEKKGTPNNTTSLSFFLGTMYRSVLLGDPGEENQL